MIRVRTITVGQDSLDVLRGLSDPSARAALAHDVMEGARAKLVSLASSRLRTSRDDYVRGIRPLEEEDGAVVLTLAGAVALMVEHGWDARDLRETLLGGPSTRVSEDGHRYLRVPLRHVTPGASPRAGQPMGSQFAVPGARSRSAPRAVVADATALGRRVHRAAKKLRPGQALPPGLAPKLRPGHATDPFAGMRASGGPRHRTYHTFRTISDARGGGWHHPGVEARDFFSEVEDYVRATAPAAVRAFVRSRLEG